MFDCFTLLSSMSEKAMAPHSSTLAWKIPWAEEPGRLQSMGLLRVGHDWATSLSLFLFHALEKEMATHSSVLAWRIPGAGEPGGLMSMGSHRVGHDWSDLAGVAASSWPHKTPIMFSKPHLQVPSHWRVRALTYEFWVIQLPLTNESTVDPWKTQVWMARVHLDVDSFC